MRTLILAAGRFGEALGPIAAGREPRLDVFELRDALSADVLDYGAVDAAALPVRLTARALGDSAALAVLGAAAAARYDAVLTTGEDIGIPFAALLKGRRRRPSHTLIAHTLVPWKKRVFFQLLRVQDQIDRILCYATSEERNMIDRLGVRAAKVQRIAFHADAQFFRPMPEVRPPGNVVASAGQLLRDYGCLVEACRDLPVEVCIAAGSPWIAKGLAPKEPLPKNVSWRRYDRFDLRELYARASVCVVPIFENDYQTGISTILEMMAMGKCVIATRTRGQTDTIVDRQNGLYVPPGDAQALRSAIRWVLDHPTEASRIGEAARAFILSEASLELFVKRIVEAVRAATPGARP
jgi:glycosyltransferase involved in cell wall biosynthesis